MANHWDCCSVMASIFQPFDPGVIFCDRYMLSIPAFGGKCVPFKQLRRVLLKLHDLTSRFIKLSKSIALMSVTS